MTKRLLSFVLATVLLVPLSALAQLPATGGCDAPDPTATLKIEDIAGDATLAGITGHYDLPAAAHPATMVVYMHGYGNISASWVCHLEDAAENHGAVAFAVDYRGSTCPENPDTHAVDYRSCRGWQVQEGADDAVAVATHFLTEFPSIREVGLLGISMGGNSSGLAAAAKATRPDGTPMFDYWVDVEGVANLAEEYVLAHAAGAASAFAQAAADDMDAECASNAPDVATCLQNLSIVNRVDDIVASGLKGVVVVHGVDDGLVPTNQSRELSTLLRLNGIPTDQLTVLNRNDGDPGEQGGTTATGTAADPLFAAAGMQYPAPLAGHGWEGSDTQLVIATGFSRLWALMDPNYDVPSNREFLVRPDGTTQI